MDEQRDLPDHADVPAHGHESDAAAPEHEEERLDAVESAEVREAAGDPAADQAADEPAADELAVDEPASGTTDAADHGPAHDDPTHDDPTHDEPAHDEPAHDGPAHDVAAAEEPTRTGNDAVDGVLASLDGLADRPVDEHVEVFERAHERLRGALDGRSD